MRRTSHLYRGAEKSKAHFLALKVRRGAPGDRYGLRSRHRPAAESGAGPVPVPGRRLAAILLSSLMSMFPVVVGLVVYLLISRSGPLGVFGLLFTPTAMIVAQW